jgi:hypothetical protein
LFGSNVPVVSFITPSPGTVSGTVTIEANAIDNVGVSNVLFKLDGVQMAPADAVPPYTLTWDTTTVIDGPHVLTAEGA